MRKATTDSIKIEICFCLVNRLDLIWCSVQPILNRFVTAVSINRLLIASWSNFIKLNMSFIKSLCQPRISWCQWCRSRGIIKLNQTLSPGDGYVPLFLHFHDGWVHIFIHLPSAEHIDHIHRLVQMPDSIRQHFGCFAYAFTPIKNITFVLPVLQLYQGPTLSNRFWKVRILKSFYASNAWHVL